MSDSALDDSVEVHRIVTNMIIDIASVPDAPSAYALMSEELRKLTDSDYAGILIYEHGSKNLRFVGAAGLEPSDMSDLPKLDGDMRTRENLTKSKRSLSFAISKLEDVPEAGRVVYESLGLGPVIIASVMFREALLGYLFVARKEGRPEFTDQTAQVLRFVSDCSASVLDHVRTSFKLARTEQSTAEILSLASIGLVTMDAGGMITSMNKIMAAIMNASSEEELIGKNILEVEPIIKSGLGDLVMQALEGIPSKKDKVHYVPAPDRAFYLHVKVIPLSSENGETETAIMIAMDVTSNVRLESQLERSYEKLIQMYQELEQVTKMKTQFIDVASHELRTPLTVLRGYLDLVEAEFPETAEPKIAEKIKIIRANADKLCALIEGMLDVSRLEKGTLQINPEPTRIDSLLREVVEARLDDAADKRQALSLEIEGELPIIMADRRRIRDVFNSILDNAVKYTPEDGKVQIGARDEGKTVHVWVKDNGVGIPLENLGKIFDRFYIVSNDDVSHSVNRIGLSLPISKGIVEAHEGRVWVESHVGRGSVFHIGLPKRLPK